MGENAFMGEVARRVERLFLKYAQGVPICGKAHNLICQRSSISARDKDTAALLFHKFPGEGVAIPHHRRAAMQGLDQDARRFICQVAEQEHIPIAQVLKYLGACAHKAT